MFSLGAANRGGASLRSAARRSVPPRVDILAVYTSISVWIKYTIIITLHHDQGEGAGEGEGTKRMV